jgi:gliding motility-associated-like protein
VAGKAQLENPSFEVCSSFPVNSGQWQVVSGWNNCGSLLASPDYYHYLGSADADVPETSMALVEPYDGDAVMGLIACGESGTNIREYISTEFATPLVPGVEYMVGFKLTNGTKTSVSTGGLGVSDLGILFSELQPLQNSQLPINFAPQFKIDTVFYSSDWCNVNFIFTADQPYRFMTFGLFGGDADKDIESIDGLHPIYAYYFVDDFYLNEVPEDYDPTEQEPEKGEHGGGGEDTPDLDDNTPHDFFIPNSFTPNGDGNNDIFSPVFTIPVDFEFSIYSRWGQLVYRNSKGNRGWNGDYIGSKAETGAYVWEVIYFREGENGESERIQRRGIVSLVR